jgi:hypothetical protein
MNEQLLAVLREGFEGPTEEVGYYLDTDAGLRRTLGALTATDASRPIGGNSVAAHAHHILFSLNAFGKRSPVISRPTIGMRAGR